MEIKVGITDVNREVVVESTESADSIQDSLAKALEDGSIFTVADQRGRKVLIPAAKIAYVDLGEENARHVGFGSLG